MVARINRCGATAATRRHIVVGSAVARIVIVIRHDVTADGRRILLMILVTVPRWVKKKAHVETVSWVLREWGRNQKFEQLATSGYGLRSENLRRHPAKR